MNLAPQLPTVRHTRLFGHPLPIRLTRIAFDGQVDRKCRGDHLVSALRLPSALASGSSGSLSKVLSPSIWRQTKFAKARRSYRTGIATSRGLRTIFGHFLIARIPLERISTVAPAPLLHRLRESSLFQFLREFHTPTRIGQQIADLSGMYHHIKQLMYTVRIGQPDPRFGNMLLEQFGGANGELAAAMQYSIQGLNCDDPDRKDLLMDIGTEELSHLEVVGALARMHLKPMKNDRNAAHEDPLIAIAGGGGVSLCNSMGNAWTADYLKITGELDVDLRSNIAAEARAKIVYERLINFTDDQGSIDTLQFLMTREITHMKAFSAALESIGKPRFSIGRIPPTPGLVDQYFNASTGIGDKGESDALGPWNEGGDWEMVTAPAFQELESSEAGTRTPSRDATFTH